MGYFKVLAHLCKTPFLHKNSNFICAICAKKFETLKLPLGKKFPRAKRAKIFKKPR